MPEGQDHDSSSSKKKEKKEKSRRPGSICYTPEYVRNRDLLLLADTAFRQQRLKAWQYVIYRSARMIMKVGKLTPQQAYPYTKNSPASVFRRWSHLCSTRWSTTVGKL